jgi:two-component system OmpR family response regulator
MRHEANISGSGDPSRFAETGTPMKLLLLEDDPRTADFLIRGLCENHYVVDHAVDGKDGLFLAAGEKYDLAIIDRMLPKVDGLTIVRTIRASGNRVPILFLTTMGGIDDRVEGLEGGGDDYLVKPFAFAELLARIGALLRRPPISEVTTTLKIADLEMNLLTRDVLRSAKRVDLQPQEYRLLEFLMRNAGRVVTRTMLLENVWGFHFDPRTTVVETHVSRLRSKMDRGFPNELIHTIRNVGYSLRAPD